MALNAAAKSINIKRSIDNYINTNLKVTESLNVDYEGVPFDDTVVADWIIPRIITMDSLYAGKASEANYGEDSNILLQFNIVVKKSAITPSDRHYAIRDIIMNYFKIGQNIMIYDWASTEVEIENARVRSVSSDFILPETNEVYNYITAFELSYTKQTTTP